MYLFTPSVVPSPILHLVSPVKISCISPVIVYVLRPIHTYPCCFSSIWVQCFSLSGKKKMLHWIWPPCSHMLGAVQFSVSFIFASLLSKEIALPLISFIVWQKPDKCCAGQQEWGMSFLLIWCRVVLYCVICHNKNSKIMVIIMCRHEA